MARKKKKTVNIAKLRPFLDGVLTKLAQYQTLNHIWNNDDQQRMADIFDEIVEYHETAVQRAYERGKAEQSLFFGEAAEA